MANKEFKDLIFYEIYPTSFYDSNNDGIGDFKGIEEKLDYIKDLGCNAIWLNPVYKSPFKDGGYDVSDFFDVDPKFGSMKDFEHMLSVAHKKGIKIVMDLVAGHLSNESKEFLESARDEKNEYSDMFIWTDNIWRWTSSYRVIGGAYPRSGSYMVNFFAFQPALNYGFKEVKEPEWQMSYKDPRTEVTRNYIVKVAKYWLNKGVDGFRVDMADSLVKNDDNKEATIEVWNDLFSRIKKDYPSSFFVSEWGNAEQSFKAGFDADFTLFHHHVWMSNFLKRYDNDEPFILRGDTYEYFLKDLSFRLDSMQKYGAFTANITGNHDTTRAATKVTSDELKTFYLFNFALPGIPFIYYGDELGLPSIPLRTKDGGYNRTGDRTPMQWDNSKHHGFSKTKKALYLPTQDNLISVSDQKDDPESIYNFVKSLIKIRKENECLRDLTSSIEVKDDVIYVSRGEMTLILNLSKKTLPLKKTVISSGKDNELKPYQSALIRK